jgi:hypothetical protein
MMNLGGVHANVSNCHVISENTTNLDGVTVDDPDDLDGGGVTLGCDREGEQDEQ